MVQKHPLPWKASSFAAITPISSPASLRSYLLPLFQVMCQITLSHRQLGSNHIVGDLPSPDGSVQTHSDYCLARFCSTQTYYHTADAHLPCTYGLCAPVLPQLPFSWRPGGFSCPSSITLLTCLARTEKADGKSRRQTNREKNIQAQSDYEARSGLILDPFKNKHHELRIQA